MIKNTLIGLAVMLMLSACSQDSKKSLSADSNATADTNSTNTKLSFSLLSPKTTVKYNYVTFEVNATDTQSMTAINTALVRDQNKTIIITGVKNEALFYFYNVPMQKGSNDINLTAKNDTESLTKLITISSDANGSAPIGMRAKEYVGIKNLQTQVEAGTLLDVEEYLFDSDGDGVIDENASDGNFSVNLTKEGRYKPRVTIRTKDDVLYSSNNFALSLDVKENDTQYDPKGAQPIDEAKSYVQAIIGNDRESVERFFGNNERLINYIYANPKVQPFLAKTYKNITSWEQTYHNSGYASVKIMIDVNGTEYGGGFEMVTINPQIKTGREWIVRFFY